MISIYYNKLFGGYIPTMLTRKLEEYMCFLPLHNLQQSLPHLICGCFNFFTFVIKVINDKWVPCHVIIGLFETPSTLGTTLAKHVKSLLAKYHLTSNIITYVKDEGHTNLITCTIVLHWQLLSLVRAFATSCTFYDT